jgi:hypothetical protein
VARLQEKKYQNASLVVSTFLKSHVEVILIIVVMTAIAGYAFVEKITGYKIPLN